MGHRAFLRITQITLVLVVLNIVSGGAVRLTDSGLGCPDWPTCARHQVTPPLSFHPAVEFGNRMVVVALCLSAAVALLAAVRRRPRRRDMSWLSAGLVAGVVGEAVLGGVVVYSKLNPYAVMIHFVVGIALLTDATVLVLRAGRPESVPGVGTSVAVGSRERTRSTRGVLKVSRPALWLSRGVVGVLALAIAAGTATTAAGPHAGGKGAKRLPVALADMARVHSGIVLVLAALTLALVYLLAHEDAPASVAHRARILFAALVAQGLVGYTQYFSHLPPLLVGVHVLGVTLVWTAALWFSDGLRFHGVVTEAGAEDTPAPARHTTVAVPVPGTLRLVADAPGEIAAPLPR